MEHGIADIDAMIREEKRLSAAESHGEAWAEGISAGIEPEIMAEEALSTAISQLIRSSGEASAVALLERVRDKALAGEYDPRRRVH